MSHILKYCEETDVCGIECKKCSYHLSDPNVHSCTDAFGEAGREHIQDILLLFQTLGDTPTVGFLMGLSTIQNALMYNNICSLCEQVPCFILFYKPWLPAAKSFEEGISISINSSFLLRQFLYIVVDISLYKYANRVPCIITLNTRCIKSLCMRSLNNGPIHVNDIQP